MGDALRRRRRIVALTTAVLVVLAGLLGFGYAEEQPLGTIQVPVRAPGGVNVQLPPVPGSSPAAYYPYYRLEVQGTYIYDSALQGQIADAECTRLTTPLGIFDSGWDKDRWGVTTQDPFDDLYDLYVNNRNVEWRPTGGQSSCATEDNEYEVTIPSTDMPSKSLKLHVQDQNYGNNQELGGLVVRVFPGGEPPQGPDDRLIETVALDTRSRNGASTLTALVRGETYKFVARGQYRYSTVFDGWLADAECSVTGSSNPNVPYDPVWRTSRSWIVGDSRDFLDIVVDGQEVPWLPLYETSPGCNARDHTYKHVTKIQNTNPVNFRIQHYHHDFDSGFVYIDIYLVRGASSPLPDATDVLDSRLGGLTRSPSADPPLVTLNISAKSKTPKEVSLPGQPQPNGTSKPYSHYRVEVSGKFYWDFTDIGNEADTECSKWSRTKVGNTNNTVPIPDPTWQQNRFGSSKFAETLAAEAGKGRVAADQDPNQDPLDLYVNGAPVDWAPFNPDGNGCNSEDHTYEVVLPLPSTRSLAFVVYDPMFKNARMADTQNISDADPSNDYSLVVRIFPAPEPRADSRHQFIETVTVDSSKKPGSTTTSALVQGQEYRFVVSNFYTYSYSSSGDFVADAECSIKGDPSTVAPDGDLVWRPFRHWPGISANEDLLDLYVNDMPVEWKPLIDAGGGCSSGENDYSYALSYKAPATARAKFHVRQATYSQSAGRLYVDVYLVKPQPNAADRPEVPETPGTPGGEAASGLFPSAGQTNETPLEILKVPSSSPAEVGAQRTYLGGQNYRVQVSGVYLWDYRYTTANRADAECTQFQATTKAAVSSVDVKAPPDQSWNPKRFPFNPNNPSINEDSYDLYVNDGVLRGQVDWVPVDPDPRSPMCSLVNTYEFIYSPAVDKPSGVLRFSVSDPFFTNRFAAGDLVVKIFQGPAPRKGPNDVLVETLQLNAASSKGVTSAASLVAGKSYRLVVEGSYLYDFARGGSRADAECSTVEKVVGDSSGYPDTDTVWKSRRLWPGIASSDDLLDVVVNNSLMEWLPLLDTGNGCNDRSHLYAASLTPSKTEPINFKTRLTNYARAHGTLKVEIYLNAEDERPEIGSQPGQGLTPTPAPTGAAMTTLQIPAGSIDGASVALPSYLDVSGTSRYYSHYLFEVSGFYMYDKDHPGRYADAECSQFGVKSGSQSVQDQQWQPARFPAGIDSANRVTPGGDPLDLYVDGEPVAWVPVDPSPSSPLCSATNRYQLTYRNPGGPSGTRTAKLAVYDPFNKNTKVIEGNKVPPYTFVLKIYPGAEPESGPDDLLLQAMSVDAASSTGSLSLPLVAGQRYRIVTDGIYSWDRRSVSSKADPECSTVPTDVNFRTHRSWGAGSTAVASGVELLDLTIGGNEVQWTPLYDPTGLGCNLRDHKYRLWFTPVSTGPVEFKIKSTSVTWMSGQLNVRIFNSRT